MPIVRVVQMPPNEIVDMIAVRDRRMPAVRSVLVGRIVFGTSVRRTGCRVCRANLQNVFVVVPIVVVVQMTVVEIIDVAIVTNRGMSAVCAVLVIVMLVNVMTHSVILSSAGSPTSRSTAKEVQMQNAPLTRRPTGQFWFFESEVQFQSNLHLTGRIQQIAGRNQLSELLTLELQVTRVCY